VNGPTLVAITLTPGGDGVAVVSRLLHDALQADWGPGLSTVTMFDGRARRPDLKAKVSFATRLDGHMLAGRPRWMLFSHLGLTRAMRYVPRLLRRPYSVFLHGTEVWKPLRHADRLLLRGAALRLANSAYTARQATALNPDIGTVVACPLALPERRCSAVGPAPTLPPPLDDPRNVVVLIVGALRSDERYKGHDQLIAAWPTVVAAVPEAHLVIVGEGDDRPRLQALAERSGTGGCISFLGFVADDVLTACYERASLFAMPSRGEGFGLVYIEAMTHRLACIGSKQDAAGEVIQDGVTGILVDQSDVDATAAAIVSLLRDPDRCRSMGMAGQARVRKEFSLPAFRSRLHAALDAAFPATPLAH
jgi:phosphatidylinositol alpha-1,6-mannosyltransferase